jgi:hypothetical protein
MDHASGAVTSPDTKWSSPVTLSGFGRSGAACSGGGAVGGCCCDTRSHVVSELVEEVWLMPET